MSIAGGLPQALVRGRDTGCGVIQIFLRNQLQWARRPLEETEVLEFRRLRTRTRIHTVFAHASYLVNLASPDPAEWRRGVAAFRDELERAERLELPFVVIHPGSHRGAGQGAGHRALVAALDELTAATPGYRVRIAIENTAGAGHLLGARAEALGRAVDAARRPERLAICLDTCHLFAAGYDIRTPRGFGATLRAFEAAVGQDQIVAFHLNDAKAGLGSRLDRHQHIGLGQIGLAAFRFLLNHPHLGARPMALETPKTDDGDRKNLAALRALRRRPSGVQP